MSTRGTLVLSSGGWHLYNELDIDEGDNKHVWLEFPASAMRPKVGTKYGIQVLRIPIGDWDIIRHSTLSNRNQSMTEQVDITNLLASVEELKKSLRNLAEAAKKPLDDMDKHRCWPPGEERDYDHLPYYYLRKLIHEAEMLTKMESQL